MLVHEERPKTATRFTEVEAMTGLAPLPSDVATLIDQDWGYIAKAVRQAVFDSSTASLPTLKEKDVQLMQAASTLNDHVKTADF